MHRLHTHPWIARGLAALLILGLVGGGYGLVSPARAGLGDSSANPLSLAEPLTTFYPVPSSAYLINPGIGWQHAPGIGTQLLPETVLYVPRPDISWRILNPGDGVYDWTALDRWINQAASQGKQVSFRVYTMRGESFGGHQVPDWVLSKGAKLVASGAPDYSNCVYQSEWARFVEALRARYDGNPTIAFIDISGYGDFNEWSWLDDQTVWDNNALDPTSLDGQARKRLADMYIGGQDSTHQCKSPTGATQTVSYSYPGFQTTQLVMPFAGTRQSTEYVASRRSDVGIRFDCLGNTGSTTFVMGKIGTQISNTWRNAPIIFETCSVSTAVSYMTEAENLLRAAHGSIVHDNLVSPRDASQVERVMRTAGYRYQLSAITYTTSVQAGGSLSYEMHWQNVGYAPAYPKMGQRFTLHMALVNASGSIVTNPSLNVNVAGWMPAATLPGTPPDNVVTGTLAVPAGLPAGTYGLRVGIRDQRTGQPLNLAIQGADALGMYAVGTIQVGGTTSPAPSVTAAPSQPSRPSATATLPPAATATPWPTVTPWPTNTPTLTPWPTVTPWPTNTPTNTPVPSATPWPTVTPWPTNTPTNTPLPSATPWPTDVPSATPWPTDTPPGSVEATPWPTETPPGGVEATPWPTDVPPVVQPTVPPAQPPGQAPLAVHLADLDGFSDGSEQRWTARVVIRVHDAQEQPAAGVTVSGQWANRDWASCVTDGNGECTLVRGEIRRGREQIAFTLWELSVPGGSYDPRANHDPDGDWELSGRRENRIRIVISR